MSETKLKTFLGRKVKGEQIVPAGSGKVEFGAAYEAQNLLNKEGYVVGMLDGNNPIGFSSNDDWEQGKWHNLSKEDKDKINGVLLSEDFKTKDVKIIFFANE